MIHQSKVDVYILVAIIMAIAVFLLGDYWIAGPVLLVLMLCAYPQSYETTPRGLLIRAALNKLLIPYEAIRFIGPASEEPDPLFSPAEQIRIRYGRGADILIAPANTSAFCADIAKRAPHLIRRGQKLTTLFA